MEISSKYFVYSFLLFVVLPICTMGKEEKIETDSHQKSLVTTQIKNTNEEFRDDHHVPIKLDRSLNSSVGSSKANRNYQLSRSRQLINRLAVSYNVPEQVHISFGSKISDIIVMWSSDSNEKSSVEFGDNPQSISHVFSKSVEMKNFSDYSKPFIHRAELTNLTPGKHYAYRIVSGTSQIKSKLFSVNIPHNDNPKGHTFMVVADMGLVSNSLQFVAQEAQHNRYDAVFHLGDIAYNLDTKGGSYGDQYMNRIEKFAALVPYMTLPGDHERFNDFYHYRYRFSSPGNDWPMKTARMWYSIDIGKTHFVSLNTQSVQQSDAYRREHLDWLERDLAAANKNRKITPWIVVMGHRPLYCTKTIRHVDCDDDNSKTRAALEDLFFKYGVDLYISGHKHCYERSWPVYKSHTLQMNTIEPKGPIYIVIGTMGYGKIFHTQLSSPKWLAASVTEKDKELFNRLNVINATHLKWTVHIGTNNKKVDEMLVIRHSHGPFGKQFDKLQTDTKLGNILKSNLMDIASIKNDKLAFENYKNINSKMMLIVGSFSFTFLVFLFAKYSRINLCVSR